MKSLTKTLLAAAAVAGTFGMTPNSAHAGIISGWNVNLSNAGSSTFTGLGDATGVGLISLDSGSGTILQNYDNSTVFGQNFTETGKIALKGYQQDIFSLSQDFQLGTAKALYFTYTLNGQVDATGNLIISGGIAKLWLDSDTDLNPLTGTVQQLTEFAAQGGTSGSTLTPKGGVPSGTISVNFKISNDLTADLFTDSNGNGLDGIAIQLANIQASIAPLPNNPNPADVTKTTGPGVQTIVVTEQGQILLSVPEPGSLALIGSALLGFGAIVRRRRKTTDA